ncbi:MAG TPA: T9SS type A sorting domain-containing protein, partial [Saprospiraceae bacterium]|nr:T9SS type A sorting domain-containing protein [Saprospiraceae bacterium]
ISGYVFGDTLTSIAGLVHAYLVDNSGAGAFQEKGSGQIGQGGFYSISGLDPGIYLIKADFDANSAEDLYYIPTYHTSSATWETADPWVLPNFLTITTDIKLVRKTGHNGGGVIGGVVTDPNHIVAGENSDHRNQTGIGHAVILLSDEYGQPIDYVKSNEDGSFRFTDLAFGTYRLKFDIPGIVSPEVWVTLTPENPEKLQITLIAENGSVAVDEPKSEIIQVYPNPTREEINVSMPGENLPFDIQIVDMQGRLVFSGSAKNYNGILSVDVSRFPTGLYHISLLNQGHRFHGRFVKQE